MLVVIDDTTSLEGSAGAWLTTEEIGRSSTTPIEAVGWVVHKDARFCSLAALRDTEPGSRSVGNVIRVPWGSITRVTKLSRSKR